MSSKFDRIVRSALIAITASSFLSACVTFEPVKSGRTIQAEGGFMSRTVKQD